MKNKFVNTLIVILILLSFTGMSFAEVLDEQVKIGEIEINRVMNYLPKEIEKDIMENYKKLGIEINDKTKRIVVIDYTQNINMIRKSFEEPIVIYEERIETIEPIEPNSTTSVSQPITRVVYNGNGSKRVTYTATVRADARYGGTDPNTGADITEYRLNRFDFVWTTNSTYPLDGVHSVDYSLQQKRYNAMWPNFGYSHIHHFPDHHSSGTYSKTVRPVNWAAVCMDWGYASASGEVKIYFLDTNYKFDLFRTGWGNLVP